MIGISGKWASRERARGSDELGRWSWITLKGKKDKMIRVYSVYRVSQDSPSQAGVLTAFQQQ